MEIYNPETLGGVISLLEGYKNNHLFRGQTPEDRVLDSTLARELKGVTKIFPPNYIPALPLAQWSYNAHHQYYSEIYSSFTPSDELIEKLTGRGDPFFEILRYTQQNPKLEKLPGSIQNHPTPLIEFSDDYRIALYFSNKKKDKNGAIFILNKDCLPTVRTFWDAVDAIKNERTFVPCLIDPLAQINDLDDQKPKRQQANYILQRNLNFSIDHYLPIKKVIIPKELNTEISSYLDQNGITETYVMHLKDEIQDNLAKT